MNKLLSILIFPFFLLTLLLGSCSKTESETDVIEMSLSNEANVQSDLIQTEKAFYYTHLNGQGIETQMIAFVLFEYEQLKTVKYQIAYLACTCRGAEVNYYSVAYIELNKDDGSIHFISYDRDSSDHYTAGLYGDSSETWDGTPAEKLFSQFREEVLLGATQETINSIEPMHGNVDTYSGATVTPNNAIRMLQSLFKYHNKKYQ